MSTGSNKGINQWDSSVFYFSVFRHDVAEIAGLTTFSFGEDEVDRYVMLFKKVLMILKVLPKFLLVLVWDFDN